MVRILCARMGDPQTRYSGLVCCRKCSRCGERVLVQRETLASVARQDHEIWCLECNDRDPSRKVIFRARPPQGPANAEDGR